MNTTCRQLLIRRRSVHEELRTKPSIFAQQLREKSSLESSTNPFDIMGIPRDSCSDVVRTTFLQLAMRYHPDTSGKDTGDKFQRIRGAFDRITKSGGKGNNKRNWLTEEVFNVWFETHTGLRMDAASRREVMIAYRDGVCGTGNTRARYLPPAWQIAFILEEEGLFTKKLSCNKNAMGQPIIPQLGVRRKRSF